MQTQLVAEWNDQGIRAVAEGDLAKAEHYFKQTLKLDEENVVAWYYIGNYIVAESEDATRNKCLDKARLAAIQSEEALYAYRDLLQQNGTPSIPIYLLQSDSPSVSERCPVTAVTFKAGDCIVVCPGKQCSAAHDVEAWEFNGYECAVCGVQTALIDRSHAPIPQPPRAKATIVIGTEETEAVTLAPSVEEKEKQFQQKLENYQSAQMFSMFLDYMGQRRREEEHQRAEEEARRQHQLLVARKTAQGFMMGLAPAILLALGVQQLFEILSITVFVGLMVAWTVSKAAAFSTFEDINPVKMYYGLLPKLAALTFVLYAQQAWHATWPAVGGALVGCLWIGGKLIRNALVYRMRMLLVLTYLAATTWTFWCLLQPR